MKAGLGRLLAAAALATTLVAAPATAHAATGCSQAGSQAAAQKYLDALVDRNAAWSIPLAPFVLRIENGLPTSVSAVDLKLQLFLHVQYSVFTSIENVVWTWQPDGRAGVINAHYDIPVGLAGVSLASSTVDEDFTLTAACTIKRIDATFTIEPAA
ncbi:hypothetical protein ASC61_06120 [Aeromicrobium sp. Root344]|uniref:hypothetical protein n=1 Tax=Aeromicrobium sp. Root344 TaxID=1736521 RepID=UPI0006FC0894|nr:hypothetical protein [Aeromicrobium sp. Root344]KQV74613.1 hypothetical protein ASC61_06120 [Aeromicrobium sp. Root344]